MNQISIGLLVAALLLLAPAPSGAQWWKKGQDLLAGAGGTQASAADYGGALDDALRVGSERVVSRLSAPGGFETDPSVHIPLPKSLGGVQNALAAVGMADTLDDLEARLNRAAEVATPKAQQLFLDAISQMTWSDARAIVEGPDDAATRYFQGKMAAPLSAEMAPVVDASLAEVGAVRAYDDAMSSYQALPFVPDASADLSAYVVEKAMDGIFHYLAIEEAAIRENPAKRSTELLQKVFGS